MGLCVIEWTPAQLPPAAFSSALICEVLHHRASILHSAVVYRGAVDGDDSDLHPCIASLGTLP